jgi:hypothetical protein
MTTMTTIGSIGCAIETHKEENEVLLDGNSELTISQNFRCIFYDSYDDASHSRSTAKFQVVQNLKLGKNEGLISNCEYPF